KQPVRGGRLVRPLVQQVMTALTALRVEDASQRRATDERAANGRKASPRRLSAPIRGTELRPGGTAPGSVPGKVPKDPDRVRRGIRIRVRDHDELAPRHGDAAVDVRAEPSWTIALEQAYVRRQLELEGQVCDDDQLFDLWREYSEAALQVGSRLVRDDDGGDPAHTSSR